MQKLKIKFLKFQKIGLQIAVFRKKTESFFNKSEKAKLIFLTTLLILSVSAATFGITHAAWTNSANLGFNTGDTGEKGDDETADKKPTTGQVENTAGGIFKMVMGFIPVDDENGGVSFLGDPAGGALSTIASATGVMYLEGPVSTRQYLAHLSKKANFGPQPVYAQGIQGFDILTPIVSLWEWSRNLVYVFYVIIFIIIGVMIIMRQRIGGQIPITIINSIPNVLLSLVLVTFSYAISGLILDLMHLANGVIFAGLFGPGGPGSNIANTDRFTFQSPEMSVFKIFGTSQITDFSGAIDFDEDSSNFMIKTILKILEDVAQWNVLISVVLSIAGVTAMFKLFFTLLTNYLTFMLYPILAPIQFLIGSLPGKSNVIGEWFKKMFAAVGAFVGVYLAFCIMIILTQSPDIGDFQWFPPMSGFSSSTETIRHLLGYAIFIATPTLPGMIQQLFKTQPGPMFAGVGPETQKAVSKIPLIGGLMG